MSRILARDCGFKMVYQYLFSKETSPENICEEYALIEEDKQFALNLFDYVSTNFDDINNKISSNLKNGLQISDLYKLDYALLLSSIAEIDYLKENVSLVINEAVELAKKYSTDNSPKFINGFLSSVYNKK